MNLGFPYVNFYVNQNLDTYLTQSDVYIFICIFVLFNLIVNMVTLKN